VIKYFLSFLLISIKVYSLTFPIEQENCLVRKDRILLTGWYTENRGTTENIRYHKAIDIPANTYTPVRAVTSGKVIEKGFAYNWSKVNQAYGNYIKILDDDGYIWLYAHLTSYDVKKDEEVHEGQVIGTVGWTGLDKPHPHLHLEKRDKHNKKILFTKDFGIKFALRKQWKNFS